MTSCFKNSEHMACSLPEESDMGSVEYKQQLIGISEERKSHLITQMKFRLSEGNGGKFVLMYVITVRSRLRTWLHR